MRRSYDWSEAADIYAILKGFGIRRGVVDVGCGEGQLVRYLRERGIEAVGCDVAGGCGGPCDVTKPETVPAGRAWVLQHVLEHVPEGAWRPLFARAADAGVKLIVAVVPGHISDDPTHICNHFAPRGKMYAGRFGAVKICSTSALRRAMEDAGYRTKLFVDTATFSRPWDLDYVVVAAKRGLIGGLLPWLARRKIAQLKAVLRVW